MEEKILTPGVISLLPMFYVGWADSVLSPSEFDLIHRKINELTFLAKDEKNQLIQWTDPMHPPSPDVFKLWIHELKTYASSLEDTDKKSLVDLGLQLARSSTHYRHEEIWKSPKTKTALLELQHALGLEAQDGINLFLHKIKPDSEKTEWKPSFEAKDLQNILDSTHTETRQRMRKLLRDPVFELRHFRDKKMYRDQVLLWAKVLAKQGLGSYAYPKEYGGQGKRGDHITVFEMLGFHDMSLAVKFGVQFGLFGFGILNLGTQKHHQAYLEKLGSADILGCFAMTETGHGSNVKGLETTLKYNHDTRKITIHSPNEGAGKEYIGNALHCTHAVVFGQLIIGEESYGIHAVVAKIRDENRNLAVGVRVEDCGYKLGLNGVDNGRIWFDHFEVNSENLLNRFGSINDSGQYESEIKNDSKRFFTMLSALVAGRVCVALAGVSASKKALFIAIKYALKRRQFAGKKGEPEMLIMDYPSHQRRLLPLLAKTYGLDAALKKLTKDFVDASSSEERRQVESLAAGLKSIATWNATEVIQECREACGGKGYLVENQFADLKADTDIFTTFEGDNTVLMQLVAKGLLSNMQKEFHDEGFIAVMRTITTRLSHTMAEYNPYYARKSDTDHLLDPDFYQDAFRYRRGKLLDSVSSRMRKYISKRVHPTDAFLRCQNHMIELAKAHVDYEILKAFYRQWKSMEASPVKSAWLKLYQLFALHTIESEKAFFMENDYMNGSKTKAIRRVVNRLCSDMRNDVSAYVDAFGIPEELIKAPIVMS